MPIDKISNLQAFADDLRLLETGIDMSTIFERATENIKLIIKWCEVNGLKISALKTKVVLWTRSRNQGHPNSIIINSINIPLSNSVKYLGVIIDNKLNWNEHINDVVIKCKRSIFAIKRTII